MPNEMGIFEVMYNCRAMRRLSAEPVPEDILLELVEAASQAATGSNKQGLRWVIVRDAEQKRQLAELNREASEAFVQGRIDRREELPHHDAERRGRMLKAVLWLAQNMQDISTLMIPCHQFESTPSEKDLAGAASSVWPGVQNMLLAARAQQLGAVLTTYALTDYSRFCDVLGLPENVGAFGLIPVGYPLGKFGPVSRLPVSELAHFDRWSAR